MCRVRSVMKQLNILRIKCHAGSRIQAQKHIELLMPILHRSPMYSGMIEGTGTTILPID